MCFQWSREERTGVFGVPAARNSVKNSVKFCSRSWPWRSRSHIGIFASSSLLSIVSNTLSLHRESSLDKFYNDFHSPRKAPKHAEVVHGANLCGLSCGFTRPLKTQRLPLPTFRLSSSSRKDLDLIFGNSALVG